jgi:hypothetical protein
VDGSSTSELFVMKYFAVICIIYSQEVCVHSRACGCVSSRFNTRLMPHPFGFCLYAHAVLNNFKTLF